MSQILICEASKLGGLCKYIFCCNLPKKINSNPYPGNRTAALNSLQGVVAYFPAGSMCSYILMWLTPQKRVLTFCLFTHLIDPVIKYYNVCDSKTPIIKVSLETGSAI